jgi:hypothetical protein
VEKKENQKENPSANSASMDDLSYQNTALGPNH